MKTISMNEKLYNYVADRLTLPHPLLKELIAETEKLPESIMQISPDQGVFMHQLVKSIQAKNILEVGCFTGFSACCMALALPENGKLITLDIDPTATDIAQKYFTKLNLDKKVELRLLPGIVALEKILTESGPNSFDFAFIDADKGNYLNYYELCLRLVKPNGLILIDNVLWSGKVIDNSDSTANTKAIRDLNNFVAKDARVESCILPISDGVQFIRKKLANPA